MSQKTGEFAFSVPTALPELTDEQRERYLAAIRSGNIDELTVMERICRTAFADANLVQHARELLARADPEQLRNHSNRIQEFDRELELVVARIEQLETERTRLVESRAALREKIETIRQSQRNLSSIHMVPPVVRLALAEEFAAAGL